MKKLIIIFIGIINFSSMLSAQVDEHITLYDADSSSTGYSIIKDEYQSLSYPNIFLPEHCNLIAYTTYGGGQSKIRIQSVAAVSKVVIYDVKFSIGHSINPTVTAIKYDPNAGCNVIVGFCEQNSDKKLFIAKLNQSNGTLISYAIHSIQISGASQYEHTYAFDIVFAEGSTNFTTTNYFAVGYVADSKDASTSLKIPFVVCFQSNLTINWVKAHTTADVNNIFNAITLNTINREIFVIGSLQKDVLNQGNTYRWETVILKFDYAGAELLRKLYVNFPSLLDLSYSGYIEKARIGDILYDAVLEKIYVLSWNEHTEQPTVQAFDRFLADQGALKLLMPNSILPTVTAFGFKLLDLKDGWIGITGYSDRLLQTGGINNSAGRDIFLTSCNLNSVDVWASLGGYINYYPIENWGFNSVNPDIHFNTLSNFIHMPHAFIPSHSIANYAGIEEGVKYFRIYMVSQKIANNLKFYPSINSDLYNYGVQLASINNYICDKTREKAEVEAITTEFYTVQELTESVLSFQETNHTEGFNALSVFVKDCFTSFKTSNLSENSNHSNIKFIGKQHEDFVFQIMGMNNNHFDQLSVFDNQGKRMEVKSTYDGNALQIKLNQYTEGIYYLQLHNKLGQNQGVKFIGN